MNEESITKRMRMCFYRDHCDGDDYLSVYGGINNKEFTTDLNSIQEWMGDPSKNGGGAKGGEDIPECALDGLYHEVEANWEPTESKV